MDLGAVLRSDMSVAEKIRALAAEGLARAEIGRRLGAVMEPQDVVRSPEMTLADKIRALDAGGLPRAEIARRLGKRYQHVRNVLEGDKLGGRSATGEGAGVEEPQRAFQGVLKRRDVEDRGQGLYRLAVREDGSVVLPAAALQALNLSAGGGVVAKLSGDEFKLISAAAAWREIDELLAPYRKEGVSWADELIAERRREAEREND